MNYRDFLLEARLEQLRNGRDGYRLVGDGQRGPDGKLVLGLMVPHVDAATWAAWAVRAACACPPPDSRCNGAPEFQQKETTRWISSKQRRVLRN